MAYGNYYGGYQTYYQPQDQLGQLRMQQQYQQPQPQSTSPLWVQGEAGAKAYPVAPGGSVILMDSESNTFYIKAADQSGMPMMRTFDYTERMPAVQNPPAQAAMPTHGDFVTRAEFEALRQQIAALTQPAPVIVQKEDK